MSKARRTYELEDLKKKTMLRVHEVAFLLDMSPQTVYNRISEKTENPFPVKPIRIGRGNVRFDNKKIFAYIEGSAVNTA